MRIDCRVSLWLVALICWPVLAVAADAAHPLATLRTQHPRLIATQQDFDRLRALVRSDPELRVLHDRLATRGQQILEQPPVKYELIGPRLLDKSRTALKRLYTLAFLYRVDRKQEYLERAVAELRAISQFQDWHPAHFLDTAEMTHAAAIGYDWLYADLSQADRDLIRRAILTKGLDAALPFYKNRNGWAVAAHNWNLVCNGGIGLGALAIAGDNEDATSKADTILRGAVQSFSLAMASYAPDGGWAEGPGYWDYATSYAVYFLAGLQTALSTDFGLSEAPGFNRAGLFRLYFTGPTNHSFNYADAPSGIGPSAAMFWLARRFNQPLNARQETLLLRRTKRPTALDLIWYPKIAKVSTRNELPLNAIFSGVNVGFLRTSWTDPNALWVAVKGGNNAVNHSHLDLGSFVLDAAGVRWAEDLGPDFYNLPGYFGKQRFSYYRLRTESHNTLLVDQNNQDEHGTADIQLQGSALMMNLAGAYPQLLSRWTRRVSIEGRRSFHIIDDVAAKSPGDLLWGMVTRATVELKGSRATLRYFQHTMEAEIQSPPQAVFDIVPTQVAPPQNQNEGTRKLVVRLPGPASTAKIDVVLRLIR